MRTSGNTTSRIGKQNLRMSALRNNVGFCGNHFKLFIIIFILIYIVFKYIDKYVYLFILKSIIIIT